MLKSYTIKNRAVKGSKVVTVTLYKRDPVVTLLDAYAAAGRAAPAELVAEAMGAAVNDLSDTDRADVVELTAAGYQLQAA